MHRIEAVIVGWQAGWNKWPDSEDRDYSSVLSRRALLELDSVEVCFRWYPIHRAYTIAGEGLPVTHPYVNNTVLPSANVRKIMVADLRAIALDGCRLCIWEQAIQCYPDVVYYLSELFRHAILIHCDDCPGSTELKTERIASYFDTVFHGNIVWNRAGEHTSALYRRLGVEDAHYIALGTTGGFLDGLLDNPEGTEEGAGITPLRYGLSSALPGRKPFSLDDRIAALRRREYRYDLAFVGGALGDQRAEFNRFVAANRDLRIACFGIGMSGGPLTPRIPRIIGRPVAKLYLSSFATINIPFIGLMGTRPFDAWASGTLLFQHDALHELEAVGVQAGKHYVNFAGFGSLSSSIRHYQKELDETEEILRAGHALGEKLRAKYSIKAALASVLDENRERFL